MLTEIINYIKKLNDELTIKFIPLKESVNLCKILLNQTALDIKKIGLDLAIILNENIGSD